MYHTTVLFVSSSDPLMLLLLLF